MLELEATVCIEAPAPAVWRWLSELEAVPLWVRAIKRAHCPSQRRGVGASRVCELTGATVVETLTAWEEGRSFCYRAQGAPLLADATNRWSVEPVGEGRALVRSRASLKLKGGALGRLLEPLLEPMFARLGARALASLKHLVEHGEAYRGPPGELPAPPAAC